MLRKRPSDEAEKPADPKGLARRPDEGAAPPAKPRLQASLEIVAGPGKGEVIVLARIVTLLGRQEGCDIVLGDETVSREHGQIEQSLDQWVYTNFSENGSHVNRKKVERAVLKSGDVIEVGSQTRLKFLLKEPEAAALGTVVRRRPRKARDEIVEFEEAPKPPDVVTTITDSFRKRRGLVIGLGLYFVLILALILLIKPPWGKSGGGGEGSVPGLDEEHVRGCLELRLGLPLDITMAMKRRDEAYIYWQQRFAGDPMSYYNALRAFTACVEYRGGAMLDPGDQQLFDRIKRELGDQLWSLYRQALQAEDRRDKQKARQCYDKIMHRVPAENELYKNVSARRGRLH